MNTWRLLITCSDRQGLVHAITGILFRGGCNVTVNHEFADQQTNRFFMRTEFSGDIGVDSILEECRSVLPEHAEVRLVRPDRHAVVVLASREHHCLSELNFWVTRPRSLAIPDWASRNRNIWQK